MATTGLLDAFPLWTLFPLTIVIAMASVEVGHRIGRYRRLKSPAEKESSDGSMVAATLGLLAFMLAFTFGMAASRFEDRRQVVLSEANAIGTTYLRTAMIPEPMRTESRNLIREYVDVRLEGSQSGKSDQAISKSEELHRKLWAQAIAAAETDRTPITSLFVQSLNEVIDLHSTRIMAGLRSRVPAPIWIGLYSLAVLAMGVTGYHDGQSSNRRSVAMIALVLAFSAVLFLIADLDRPGQGLLLVSQQSMLDLRNSIAAIGSTP